MSTMHQASASAIRHQVPGSRRPLILFFVLAYGLSWAVWGTAPADQAEWID